MDFSSCKKEDLSRSSMTNWHAGFVYKLDLPLGFSFQPALIYHQKGMKAKGDDFSSQMGFMEVPLSIHWGPDLLVFSPFLDVTPFVGYGVYSRMWADGIPAQKGVWDGVNRFEYGIGIGIGLEIWRLQVSARYFWNFGDLRKSEVERSKDFATNINSVFNGNNFRGIMLSAAIFLGK